MPRPWAIGMDVIEAAGLGILEAFHRRRIKAAGYLEIRQERIKGKVSRSVWTVTDTPQGCFDPTVSPQGRYPPMENSPYTKERINKRNKAAPALEGGAQLPEDIFFDHESGEFRRKGSA